MALTAKRQLEQMGQSLRISGKFKKSDTYYKGAILCYNINGLLAVGAGAATDIPAGIYTGYGTTPGDDGLVVGAGGTTSKCEVDRGCFWIPFSGAAQADVGLMFYVADDDTVTKTVGTNTVGMIALAFKTGYVLLDFSALLTVDTTS